MKGKNGLVFGRARWAYQHWFLFDVGGDANQVQLNIGMFPKHIRVGLGFMIGRQVAPKPPAFQVFQTFIGARPPLPFRNALLEAISTHRLRIEIQGEVEKFTDPDKVLAPRPITFLREERRSSCSSARSGSLLKHGRREEPSSAPPSPRSCHSLRN
jgi:hypothetical protein